MTQPEDPNELDSLMIEFLGITGMMGLAILVGMALAITLS